MFICLSTGIEQNIKIVSEFEVAFTSPIHDYFIPLQEVRQSLARVIFLLSSVEVTLHTLCLAFHEGMILATHPEYQYAVKHVHNFVLVFQYWLNISSWNSMCEDVPVVLYLQFSKKRSFYWF